MYKRQDYYYQCNETNAALRESVKQMIEKWDLDEIDCDKIEANSSLTSVSYTHLDVYKRQDQLGWVRKMNSIRSRAEEVVLHDLIYMD